MSGPTGRRARRSIAGDPVLVGAVTVLIVAIAVFLSYGANNGLPFVPTYDVSVDLPSAGHLVRKNAEVQMAGTRIGQVTRSEALPGRDGRATARLHLVLKKEHGPLPLDTRFRIRPAGSIGVDLVEVVRGRSMRTFEPGSVVPEDQVLTDSVPNEDFMGTFSAPVRDGIRNSVAGGGYGFAGRGPGLNRAITGLEPLLEDLGPVMAQLRDPETRLGPFLRAFRDLAGEVAPVAREQALLITELNTTFAAMTRDPGALRDLISASPATLEATVRDAPAIDALLRTSTALAEDLAPAARRLPGTARTLAGSLRAGLEGLPATQRTLPRVDTLTARLASFAQEDSVLRATDRVAETGRTLEPLTSFITPAQTVCNYGALLLRNLSSMVSEGPVTGTTARIVIVAVNGERFAESVLSPRPSNGPEGEALGFLHSTPYPNTAAPGQVRECEAGQEPFITGRPVIGNLPGDQDAVTEEVGG